MVICEYEVGAFASTLDGVRFALFWFKYLDNCTNR